MEDTSDFAWDSAQACHAVVLTYMEADRLSWTDTDKIDRIHHAHTQRHATGAQTSASRSSFKKTKKPHSKNGVIFRKVPANSPHITEQLACFTGVSVKLVTGHI